MQEHPIPRQITTFEFKLIGELTIKQFGYLAFGTAGAVILFFLIPSVLFLNIIFAAIPALLGVGFAFIPVNDRPMDIWLRNLFKRLFSPTQYFYHKHNRPPKILLGLELPPRAVLLQHIKAQQSLNEYLQKKPKTDVADNIAQLDKDRENRKTQLQAMMIGVEPPVNKTYTPVAPAVQDTVPQEPAVAVTGKEASTVNFKGTVYTPNGFPLVNQMVYVKQNNETVRLFRTNSQGQFQNNLPLPQGDYFLEVVDPQKKHDFARMKIDTQASDLQIYSQK